MTLDEEGNNDDDDAEVDANDGGDSIEEVDDNDD